MKILERLTERENYLTLNSHISKPIKTSQVDHERKCFSQSWYFVTSALGLELVSLE